MLYVLYSIFCAFDIKMERIKTQLEHSQTSKKMIFDIGNIFKFY